MFKFFGRITGRMITWFVGWISFLAGGFVDSSTVSLLLLGIARVVP